MKFSLREVVAYSAQGRRQYQQDDLLVTARLLVVADGLGGHVGGEVASANAVAAARAYVAAHPPAVVDATGSGAWGAGLAEVCHRALLDCLDERPELLGMGTTLIAAASTAAGLLIVQVGDSRAYVVSRDLAYVRATTDHSVYEESIASGEATPEEAASNLMGGMLTQSLIADPFHRFAPTVTVLDDVPPGSRLLLCSDGVLEAWRDERMLCELLAEGETTGEIAAVLCQGASMISRDNHTAVVGEVG